MSKSEGARWDIPADAPLALTWAVGNPCGWDEVHAVIDLVQSWETASDGVICANQNGQLICDFTSGHRGAHAARRTTREIVATWDEDES